MRRWLIISLFLIALTSGCNVATWTRLSAQKSLAKLPTNLSDLPAQGHLEFPTIGGDAGFLDIQAGDTITVKWIDGPTNASKVIFVLQDENLNKTVIGEDTKQSDGISMEWQVPAHVDGDLFAIAIAGATTIRSEAAGTLSSGDLPPADRCVIGSSTIGAITIFDNPTDENRIGELDPGQYATVIQAKSDGWVQIDTSNATMDQSSASGWIAPDGGFHFSGPCAAVAQTPAR